MVLNIGVVMYRDHGIQGAGSLISHSRENHWRWSEHKWHGECEDARTGTGQETG